MLVPSNRAPKPRTGANREVPAIVGPGIVSRVETTLKLTSKL